ncbi:MAG: hypothetical protein JWM86_1611, partial [Thermoleophilia bacterium]|nr:hypothetical protein [Thermoleophilia bacterium]
EVLVPYLAKHELGHGAGGLGVILACGGLGSMLASVLVGQRGLPSRPLAFMYACWIAGCALMAVYALADGLVLASAVAFVTFGIMTASWVAQAVVMQQQVPQHLLGRVTSFDWLLSSAAAPIGFAAVGPVADAIGTRETFAWMGLAGVVATALLLPRSGARTIRLRDEAEDAPAAAEATAQG